MEVEHGRSNKGRFGESVWTGPGIKSAMNGGMLLPFAGPAPSIGVQHPPVIGVAHLIRSRSFVVSIA